MRGTSAERKAWAAHWTDPGAEDIGGPFTGHTPTKARAVRAFRQEAPLQAAVSQAATRVMRRTEAAAEAAAGRVAANVAKRVLTPASVAAGAVLTGKAVAVVAAAALGYFSTRLTAISYELGRDRKVQLANQAYRDARTKLMLDLGLTSPRDIPRVALQPLTDAWRVAIANAESNQPLNPRGSIY